MLSIIADAMLVATRTERDRFPDRKHEYADRFVSDPARKEHQRNRRHNPYSYFQ